MSKNNQEKLATLDLIQLVALAILLTGMVVVLVHTVYLANR